MSAGHQGPVDIRHLRDAAVSAVLDALHARHPGLARRFGARGMKTCREDIYYHLD